QRRGTIRSRALWRGSAPQTRPSPGQRGNELSLGRSLVGGAWAELCRGPWKRSRELLPKKTRVLVTNHCRNRYGIGLFIKRGFPCAAKGLTSYGFCEGR